MNLKCELNKHLIQTIPFGSTENLTPFYNSLSSYLLSPSSETFSKLPSFFNTYNFFEFDYQLPVIFSRTLASYPSLQAAHIPFLLTSLHQLADVYKSSQENYLLYANTLLLLANLYKTFNKPTAANFFFIKAFLHSQAPLHHNPNTLYVEQHAFAISSSFPLSTQNIRTCIALILTPQNHSPSNSTSLLAHIDQTISTESILHTISLLKPSPDNPLQAYLIGGFSISENNTTVSKQNLATISSALSYFNIPVTFSLLLDQPHPTAITFDPSSNTLSHSFASNLHPFQLALLSFNLIYAGAEPTLNQQSLPTHTSPATPLPFKTNFPVHSIDPSYPNLFLKFLSALNSSKPRSTYHYLITLYQKIASPLAQCTEELTKHYCTQALFIQSAISTFIQLAKFNRHFLFQIKRLLKTQPKENTNPTKSILQHPKYIGPNAHLANKYTLSTLLESLDEENNHFASLYTLSKNLDILNYLEPYGLNLIFHKATQATILGLPFAHLLTHLASHYHSFLSYQNITHTFSLLHQNNRSELLNQLNAIFSPISPQKNEEN